jgi:flagellar biosynthesis protein FlhA
MASFPTMLLFTTLYRLSLNVASTRLIIGQGEAGDVIAAFGKFVGGDNLVVGFIVFLLIMMAQFLVITKGAERVSEVAAASPGCDARQADGHGRRSQLRSHHRCGCQGAAQEGAAGGRLLRRHGRRVQICQERRHLRHHRHVLNVLGGIVMGMVFLQLEIMEALERYAV